MKILVNHIGYELSGTKNAVAVNAEKDVKLSGFTVVCSRTGDSLYSGTCEFAGEVARWNKGHFWTIDFTDLTKEGEYYIEIECNSEKIRSFPFRIKKNMLGYQTLSDVGYYFKAQRDSGEIAQADTMLKFKGGYREGTVDAHGSWYDATGDYAQYLSHLTFSTYFNPQQAPLADWVFFKAIELLEKSGNEMYSMLKRRFLDEAIFGAEWLYRMMAPSGSFYRSVNRSDAFGEVADNRYLAYEHHFDCEEFSLEHMKELPEPDNYNYESSFRSGAGLSIACLANASRWVYPSEFSQSEYLKAAKDSYRYMSANNEKHTNDGKNNFLDYYCELIAVTELYRATGEVCYKLKAREVAKQVMAYYVPLDDSKGYWCVDGGESKRPFFHAADAGLPVVALLNYYELETLPELRAEVLDICSKSFKNELEVTNEVANPFGYARHLVCDRNGKHRTQFFFRHDTETGGWWQGDNARIASLSTAARYLAGFTRDLEFRSQLNRYADNQLNWILGLNPFDSCMMQGQGRNNPRYFFKGKYDFIACPGGIVNGITGGLEDEDGIEFIIEPTDKIDDNWRWAEQWIPHAAWYLFAVAMKRL